MKSNHPSAGRSLIRTVIGKRFGDVVFDVAEVALDQNLSNGVLRDMPFIGMLVKMARAGQSISEELFVRKLILFLTALNAVPIGEREKLLVKYPDCSDQQQELGENLLLAIERLDDVTKPAILARFFAAYVKEEIDYTTFTRLARALDKFNLSLMPNLRWYCTREEPVVETTEEIVHELSLAGLVTLALVGSGAIGGGAGYRHSSLGKTFLRVGFDITETPAE